jgi:hypothetical protein
MDKAIFYQAQTLRKRIEKLKEEYFLIQRYPFGTGYKMAKFVVMESPSQTVLDTCQYLVGKDLKKQLETAEKEFAGL